MLGDEGLIAMASCIHNVENVLVGREDDENISVNGIQALYEAIKSRPKPVSALHLLLR